MRCFRTLLFVFLACLLLGGTGVRVLAEETLKSWTNTAGTTIQAEFVRLDGGTLVIRKDGKPFSIPLASLSPASQEQAKELATSKTSKSVAKTAEKPAEKAEELFEIKGTCTFQGKQSTWSAILTPNGDKTYEAVYAATWSGRRLKFVGTITTDMRSEIQGRGKARGGGASGTFEFSGRYGGDGIARCSYKEDGGSNRNGSLTAEMPQPAKDSGKKGK